MENRVELVCISYCLCVCMCALVQRQPVRWTRCVRVCRARTLSVGRSVDSKVCSADSVAAENKVVTVVWLFGHGDTTLRVFIGYTKISAKEK